MPFWLAPRGVQHQRFHQVWRAISGLPAWQGSGKVLARFASVFAWCRNCAAREPKHQFIIGGTRSTAYLEIVQTLRTKPAYRLLRTRQRCSSEQQKQQPGRCRKLWICASAPRADSKGARSTFCSRAAGQARLKPLWLATAPSTAWLSTSTLAAYLLCVPGRCVPAPMPARTP